MNNENSVCFFALSIRLDHYTIKSSYIPKFRRWTTVNFFFFVDNPQIIACKFYCFIGFTNHLPRPRKQAWNHWPAPSCICGIINIIPHLEAWKILLLKILKTQVLLVKTKEKKCLHMWSSSVLGTDSIYSLLGNWNQLSFCNPMQSNMIVLLPKKGKHSIQVSAVPHKTKRKLLKWKYAVLLVRKNVYNQNCLNYCTHTSICRASANPRRANFVGEYAV